MRLSSPVRSTPLSHIAIASATSTPIPCTCISLSRDARKIAAASVKYSSNCRTRIGPTCSIMFSAINASVLVIGVIANTSVKRLRVRTSWSASSPRKTWQASAATSLAGSQVPQVIEGIDSARMSVSPLRLNRITADGRDTNKLKGRGWKRFRRSLVDLAHNIGLAFASGAGTISAEVFQRDIGFGAIIPLDGQFVADVLNINRFHRSTTFGRLSRTLKGSIHYRLSNCGPIYQRKRLRHWGGYLIP